MPFVERDEDRYPTGFFAEVLSSVFTPAITGAGLQVRTAQRPGSDLIQSTIVTELLEADLVLADLTEHNPNVLFELGMRIAENKPVVLIRSKGTGRIFDVDHVLRIEEYSPNLWPSTVAEDCPKLEAHIKAAWDNRDSVETYRNIPHPPVVQLGLSEPRLQARTARSAPLRASSIAGRSVCPGTSLPIRGNRQTKRPRRGVTSTRPGLSTEEHAFDAAPNGSCLLLFSVGSLARASSAFRPKGAPCT
jgi:hypothetical protein